MRIYQSFFLWRLALVRLRRLCLFIFKRRFFLRLPIWYLFVVWYGMYWKKKDPRLPLGRRGSQDWQQLTLTRQRGRTTISDRGLNERVRDGNVCFPSSMITRLLSDGVPNYWWQCCYRGSPRLRKKNSLTSGNASVVRKNDDYDEWNVSDH